jgi:hypothetical protein
MDDQTTEPHVFPTSRRPGEYLFAVLLLALSVVLLIQIDWQTTWLDGKGLAAQPRTWPFIALAGMTAFGVGHVLMTGRRNRTPGRWREALLWVRSLEYVGWYLLYVAAVPMIGYLGATLAFCLFLTWRSGYRDARFYAAAAGFALFVVLLFKTTLHVRIPGGAIYEALPGALRSFMILNF